MKPPNRFDLYERCTQSPADMARVLDAIHGEDPRVLAEDFAGTAATSRAWLGLAKGRKAVAVDLDPEALAHAPRTRGLAVIEGNVLDAPRSPRPDIIFVGNFSICEWHTREELDRYLARSFLRLARGGVLACDLYDGPSAWRTGVQRRTLDGPRGTRITYTWRQVAADLARRRVVNEIDFAVRRAGVTMRLPRAFTYDWKLWSPRTLASAMKRAGFTRVELFEPRLDAIDSTGRGYISPSRRADMPRDAVLLVVGRKG